MRNNYSCVIKNSIPQNYEFFLMHYFNALFFTFDTFNALFFTFNTFNAFFLSGCIACHGFPMRHDLYGTSESGLDATFDLVAQHITAIIHRAHSKSFEGYVSTILPASVTSDSSLRCKSKSLKLFFDISNIQISLNALVS